MIRERVWLGLGLEVQMMYSQYAVFADNRMIERMKDRKRMCGGGMLVVS